MGHKEEVFGLRIIENDQGSRLEGTEQSPHFGGYRWISRQCEHDRLRLILRTCGQACEQHGESPSKPSFVWARTPPC